MIRFTKERQGFQHIFHVFPLFSPERSYFILFGEGTEIINKSVFSNLLKRFAGAFRRIPYFSPNT